MFLTSVLLLGLTHLAASKPFAKRWDDFEVKHAWAETPRGWAYHAPAPADYSFDMRIGLKQDRFDELVANLYQVSDPAHSRYGQHLSKDQIAELVAPHPQTVDLVEAWLAAHDLDAASARRSPAGDWLTLRVTVAQAERMLGNEYAVYRHADSDERVVRAMSYSLPAALRGRVSVVAPTTYFGTMRAMRTAHHADLGAPVAEEVSAVRVARPGTLASVPSSCASLITPDCLHALYNTTGYVPAATDVNSLGVAGYLDQYANRADLQTFLRRYRTDAVGSSFETVLVNDGGDDQSDPGIEANLDIQYTIGMAYPTPNTYYSTGGSPPFIPDGSTPTNTNEPYLDWLHFILAQDAIPQTFTTSYGEPEQTIPPDYAVEVCHLFAQLGARGSSVLFSSGDSGVGSHCTSNDGANTTKFLPHFPASCPFVTAVGGTESVNPEVAAGLSGGGFSDMFAMPDYQTEAVAGFLTTLGSPTKASTSGSGRAYPDVSAQAENFAVVYAGFTYRVGGTSASSPTVAGVIALLNDYRLSQGKPALGFLNPLLYSIGTAGFNDITSGTNPGCNTAGFTAVEGWDPVRHWLRTPDFGKLQALLG
ncbi:subtilisin-like protein [Epithele typhae]|uniref:subtilisin-like protein n=1 Tax=Epithele typhae TaxID=378194 RepID=UPI00200832FE|nr:subtilisin-like protein [Epithele typhae]KAH9940766.1 subtilisin-like protein [Epithele typhae]